MSYSEFDIIFAGGGTAACLIAGRLAAADPSLKILVIEAGPHTLNNLSHVQPARYLSHLAPNSTTAKFVVSNVSEALGGRPLIVPCGQCVGGGSSINFAGYTRASASDYDDWENKYENPGWGSKDLVPMLRKTETYQPALGLETHGYSGPLKVSYGGIFTNIGQDFLRVGPLYDQGRRSTTDPNGLYSVNEYGRWQKWISGDTGTRSDVPHHFIYNQAHNKNLQILTGCLVKRVIFEGTHAKGVEYVYNTRFHPDASTEVHIAFAGRLVVVSAGSFGSPSILERSGIGAKSLLHQFSIKQLVDLPGVGENYQDHLVIFPPYRASDESETLDGGELGNQPIIRTEWDAKWHEDGTGIMAHNGIDGGIKLRPNEKELREIGPAFEERWQAYFAGAPDKPILWMGSASLFVGDATNVPAGKYFSVGYYVEYPASLGHVHITSGDDVNAPPHFETGFLKPECDVAILIWAYKRSREIARRMNCYRGECAVGHPVFSGCSEAEAAGKEEKPVSIEAPDINYTQEDEKAIEEFTRKFVATAWHSLGTCAMKPRAQGGVVDHRLNVYGIQGLKVADLSIAPSNVSANTYSTTLAIAEKAADIIAEELGIVGV